MLEKKPAKLSVYIGTDKQATFRLAILFPFRGKHHRNVVLFSLKKWGHLGDNLKNRKIRMQHLCGFQGQGGDTKNGTK